MSHIGKIVVSTTFILSMVIMMSYTNCSKNTKDRGSFGQLNSTNDDDKLKCNHLDGKISIGESAIQNGACEGTEVDYLSYSCIQGNDNSPVLVSEIKSCSSTNVTLKCNHLGSDLSIGTVITQNNACEGSDTEFSVFSCGLDSYNFPKMSEEIKACNTNGSNSQCIFSGQEYPPASGMLTS